MKSQGKNSQEKLIHLPNGERIKEVNENINFPLITPFLSKRSKKSVYQNQLGGKRKEIFPRLFSARNFFQDSNNKNQNFFFNFFSSIFFSGLQYLPCHSCYLD
jgi:hypothetical protein